MAIDVGPVVRRLRERHRMTQQELVEYTGLDRSASYISSIETGRTSPTLYELEQIARVYQVPLQQLLQEGGQAAEARSEEHTSELQSQSNLVCRLLLEKKKQRILSQNY